jgi:ABC-2 type transport system ATP-binding protein
MEEPSAQGSAPPGPNAEAVVTTEGLVKRFGAVTALDGLDLTVRAGQIHGFLGPNGAGKSTTLRVLLGQLRADDGVARVFGLDPWSDAVRIHERVAYVPGDVTLWQGLTGGECIDILGTFHGAQRTGRRDELIERFELDPTRRTRAYSKGNRRKVALIAGLATNAELLLLDEPTAGLDPLMEAEFQAVARELAAEGRTILLSSHILGEVEALCDHVSIIRSGRTVRTGTLADLRAHTSTTVAATTPRPVDAIERQPGVATSSIETLHDGRSRTTLHVVPTAVPAILERLLAAGAIDITVAPPSLDRLFLEEYRETAE